MRQELGMPEPEKDARSEARFPVLLGGDEGMHEREQPDGVVVHFDINVQLDMRVLGL